MASKYRINVQLDLDITDEMALRQVAHEEILKQLAANGGVAPNEFAQNDQQAADFMTHEIRVVVSMAAMRGLFDGMANVPGALFSNPKIQNEPIE